MFSDKVLSFFVNNKQFDDVEFDHKYEIEIYNGYLHIIIDKDCQMQLEYKLEIDGQINIVKGTKAYFNGIKIKIELDENGRI